MSLDFWNNPLVVSSFRHQQRRRTYSRYVYASNFLFLMILGQTIPYFKPDLRPHWNEYAFQGLMGIQFLMCGFGAGAATNKSMKNEVVNQTFDFLRIASLSPRQILIGKLFGEGAGSFFLGMSTFPLGIICFVEGGVSFDVLVLMYVNLATFTFVCGALGLLVELEPRKDAKPDEFSLSLFLGLPWGVPPFVALAQDNLFLRYGILTMLPLVHVAAAFLAIGSKERRLNNPLTPALSKRTSYVLLTVLDLSAALIFFFVNISVSQCVVGFCAFHLLASLMMIHSVTPWRETLRSWAWRFRGRTSWARDSLLGDLSENAMALVTFCVIGLATLVPFVLVPALSLVDAGPTANEWLAMAEAVVLTLMLILSLGSLHQFFLLFMGKTGGWVAPFFFTFMTIAPHLFGQIPGYGWLLHASPSAHFAKWIMDPAMSFSFFPLLLLYGLPGLIGWRSLRAGMAALEKSVDQRLDQMGVTSGAVRKP